MGRALARFALCVVLGAIGLVWPSASIAQADDVFGPQAFDGIVDVRASVVDGEKSWLEGGFGKLYLAYLREPAGNKLCALYRVPKA